MPDPQPELTRRRRRLVIANWKMNGTLAQLRPLVTALQAGLPAAGSAEVVICPPALYLAALADTDFALGAQDVSAHLEGAHTGELSAAMLKDYNCRLVILGHSERRQGQQESDETVALKCSAALEAGLVPVLCVGERAAEDTEKVVIRQLDAVLARCGQDLVQRGVVAYEPVWAIGTGRSASPEHAGGVHALIRRRLNRVDATAAQAIRIVYGGSVNPENIRALLAIEEIDGVLVGGASLKADAFISICTAAEEDTC